MPAWLTEQSAATPYTPQSKIVRQEAMSIESAHEKKIKQAQVANKM